MYMDINFRLTTLENKYALMGTAMRDVVITMLKDLTSVTEHMFDLNQSLSTAPIYLWTLVKRMDNMEEQLDQVHDAIGGPLDEPSLCL